MTVALPQGKLDEMVRAYLDTNVYLDIATGIVPRDALDEFQAARQHGEVVVLWSVSDLEEMLGLWGTDRQAALQQLRIFRDFTGTSGLLKQPSDILTDAIRAYAEGGPAPGVLLPRGERRTIVKHVNDVLGGHRHAEKIVSDIVASVRANKTSFEQAMEEAGQKALSELVPLFGRRHISKLSFEEYAAGGPAEWAADFADHFGVGEECRRRGLEGLVRLKAVHLFFGALMSVVHAQVCMGRKPDHGYDLWHVICASAAEVFVTNDKRLFDHVAHVGAIDGFRTVRSLTEVLGHPPA